MFRGYISTNGKRALMRYKDVPDRMLLSESEADAYDHYAGVLRPGVVLFDFDNKRHSDIVYNLVRGEGLSCFVQETTRGKHFIFADADKTITKCSTGATLACMLDADIKTGASNSYCVLKKDGERRRVLREPSGELSPVPAWLSVVKRSGDAEKLLSEGNRNSFLYAYILTLQSASLSKPDIIKTLNIINNHVLDAPLSREEMDVITRDESFEKATAKATENRFFYEKTFLFDAFSEYIRDKNHVIKINSVLHIYDKGKYTPDNVRIESKMIKVIPLLAAAKRQETLKYMNISILENTPRADAKYILFSNGILDITTRELLPHTPELIFTNIIPHDYIADTPPGAVDDLLLRVACGDRDTVKLLEECVGYCLYRKNELGKAFLLVGEGSNGKSTFLDMVTHAIGDENISSLDLCELGEKFINAQLFNKLVNIGDDIGDGYIDNSSLFKKFVTGERVAVQNKGESPFEFNNYSKFIFSANSVPRMKDRSNGLMRRLEFIPFTANFSASDSEFDPFIKYKLRTPDNVSRLLWLAVEGLIRVLSNNAFTQIENGARLYDDYEESNNNVVAFIKEYERDNIIGKTSSEVYDEYIIFCKDNGFREPQSKPVFSKNIASCCGIKTADKRINGIKQRIFVE